MTNSNDKIFFQVFFNVHTCKAFSFSFVSSWECLFDNAAVCDAHSFRNLSNSWIFSDNVCIRVQYKILRQSPKQVIRLKHGNIYKDIKENGITGFNTYSKIFKVEEIKIRKQATLHLKCPTDQVIMFNLLVKSGW